MKILIIGGAGYLGAVTVRFLLNLGHEVTVIDDFRYSGESLLELCSNRLFSVIKSDVRDIKAIKSYIDSNEIIIPFSAIVGKPLCEKNVSECYSINVEVADQIISCISENQWIIYPSTQSCYGNTDPSCFCNEFSALNPLSHYAKSKCMAEQSVMKKSRYFICRFATLYGVSPRMRTDLLINKIVSQAVFDGYTVLNNSSLHRDYLHVYDGARAIGHIINHLDVIKPGIYNVGDQAMNCTPVELCDRISNIIPGFKYYVDDSIESHDDRNYQVSIEKFYATDWRPSKSLEDGVIELVKAYTMLQIHRYVNN